MLCRIPLPGAPALTFAWATFLNKRGKKKNKLLCDNRTGSEAIHDSEQDEKEQFPHGLKSPAIVKCQ